MAKLRNRGTDVGESLRDLLTDLVAAHSGLLGRVRTLETAAGARRHDELEARVQKLDNDVEDLVDLYHKHVADIAEQVKALTGISRDGKADVPGMEDRIRRLEALAEAPPMLVARPAEDSEIAEEARRYVSGRRAYQRSGSPGCRKQMDEAMERLLRLVDA